MNNGKILIISDFDGTFAGNDGRIVSKNCEAIKRFIKNGGYFTFASGRGPRKMKELFPEFVNLVNAPMIMVNGEMLYDPENDQIICESPLNSSVAAPVARDILSKFPALTILITDGEEFTSDNPPSLNKSEEWRMMTPFGDAATITKCHAYINEHYLEDFTVRRPSPCLIDMTRLGVNKGTRIPFIREYFANKGINDLKIYCVGDYGNDLDMLLSADAAFCPSNAIDEIKKVCRSPLCDHDEGAIADLISKIENNEI
jgi:HAD superfamily hydrolase (TIGR01484 family)